MQSYNFHLTSACDYKIYTLPHHTIFLTARGRSEESLSIPAATQENLEPIPPLCSLELHQKQKDGILDSSCVKPGTSPLNKTRYLPTSCLTISHLSHLPTSLTSDFSHVPTSLPPHLSHLTTLYRKTKHSNITTIGFLSLPT